MKSLAVALVFIAALAASFIGDTTLVEMSARDRESWDWIATITGIVFVATLITDD